MPPAADVEFPIVRRGYDRLAVDAYVRKTTRLLEDLQATHSPDAAVRRALERVGAQVSGILKRAHESAEQITSGARRDAEEQLEEARQEAARIIARAINHVKELDADTDRIWAERHRIIGDARELAMQLQALADSAAERFPGVEEPESEPVEGPIDEGELEDEAFEDRELEEVPGAEEQLVRGWVTDRSASVDEDTEDSDLTDPTDPVVREQPGADAGAPPPAPEQPGADAGAPPRTPEQPGADAGAPTRTPDPAIDAPDPDATAVLRPLRDEPERRGW
jgi:cell division septum initiation protein DivIVA